MPNLKITKTAIDSAKAEPADYFIWDRDLKGFGLKVSKGGRKTYVCQYRTSGGRTGDSRRLAIGAHGSPWTVETARSEARKILGRAVNGEDPAQEKQNLKKRLSVVQPVPSAWLCYQEGQQPWRPTGAGLSAISSH